MPNYYILYIIGISFIFISKINDNIKEIVDGGTLLKKIRNTNKIITS